MSDDYRYKQVIVMRDDLNMRKGKMVAQGAHASLGAVLTFRDRPEVDAWLAGPFAKVCVRVSSEAELIEIFERAEAAGMINYLITDAGKTEFKGLPTLTCCAVGPDTIEKVDAITGHLKLL